MHTAWFEIWIGHIFYEKSSPLSRSKLSNMINSLAVLKRGSDLPPSVGRSGSALGNGSAIDAKVSWFSGEYRIQTMWIRVCYATWEFSRTWSRHIRPQTSAINEFQRNVIQLAPIVHLYYVPHELGVANQSKSTALYLFNKKKRMSTTRNARVQQVKQCVSRGRRWR